MTEKCPIMPKEAKVQRNLENFDYDLFVGSKMKNHKNLIKHSSKIANAQIAAVSTWEKYKC